MTAHETNSPGSIQRAIAARLLPRYASGTLPGVLRRLVRDVLDADADLAARYHLLRRLERQARGDDAALSAAQEDVILAGVLDGLDGDRSTVATASSLRLSTWSGALAAAAAVAFVVVAPGPDGPDDPGTDPAPLGLQARGDLDDAPLGLRVRCVDGSGARVLDDATAGARQKVGALSCVDDGLLAFSLTNLSAHERFVFVVGVADDGRVVYLPPFAEDARALSVPAGAVDVVVDRLAPMPVLDTAGLTLHVLVDDAPFSGAEIGRRLQAASVADLPLSSLDRLPVDVDVQARLNVYRRP
jgi:hypothetical protein